MMHIMWLRGPYAEGLEPALESCMKCGRICEEDNDEQIFHTKYSVKPALTVMSRMHNASIRVVPPSLRSLWGRKALSICANKQSQEDRFTDIMLAWMSVKMAF